MGFFRYFRSALTRTFIGVFLIASLLASPAYSVDTKDSQIFISGFNAYLKRDYQAAIDDLSGVLEKYPDTSLRDMAILWLSRAHFKAGHQKEAAQYMAQFFKEYPESPLKGTIEDELTELALKYQQSEPLAAPELAKAVVAPSVGVAGPAVSGATQQVISAKAEADRQVAEKAAAEKVEAERQATEKAFLAKSAADRQAAEQAALAKAEADRQAAEQAALAKAEADRQAAEQAALAKAEADRQAAEQAALAKAEADRQAAEQAALAKAESDRQAAEQAALAKAEADRQAAEQAALAKAEADRQAAEQAALAKAEAERLTAEKAALAKAEADRQAAEQAALAKAEAERQAAEKAALAKAEADRQAAEQAALAKAEAERLTAEKAALAKAEADRQAAEQVALAKAEADRLTAEQAALAKAEADRLTAEQVALAKAAADRQAAEQAALAKAEADRQAAEKAALAKAEAERQPAEQAALTKAEADRQMAEKRALAKAEADRQAAERAALLARIEANRQAAEQAALAKAESDRLTAEKAALSKAEAERQAAEQIALAKAEAERQAAEQAARAKAEADRRMAEKRALAKAEADRQAAEMAALLAKIETERQVAEKAAMAKVEVEQQSARKLALAKAAAERQAAEQAALAKAESGRQAAEKRAAAKAEADRQSAEKAALAKAAAENKITVAAAEQKELKLAQSLALRDQAITEYKAVVDRYPESQAAANASARLKDLGLEYPLKTVSAAAARVQAGENSNILAVEVGQQAELEFSLAAAQQTVEIGKRFAVPFEVVNRGNLPDNFIFESGFPAEYQPRFVAAAAPELALVKTPQLLPGERFSGMMQFDMPSLSMDGERKLFPVKVTSEADATASQSRPLRFMAKAPILRAVIKSDVTQANPGERIPYRLVLLNVGSSAAREVALNVTFPPQYEPVDSAAAGFRLEGSNTLVVSGIQLAPGESREIAFAMQLKESALAKEELFLHVDMNNTTLNRTDKFVSAAVAVKSVSGVRVQASAEKIIAVPGQAVTVSLAVTNTGNVRDDFEIKPLLADNLSYSIYLDLNRDGVRQANEPIANHVGPLAPREVANLILEITTSAAEKDGVTVPLTIRLDSENDSTRHTTANLNLVYSRPVLNLTVTGKAGKIRPGEVNSFELTCVNAGSSMAKMVDVRSSLPDQLELIAAEPVIASKVNGEYSWRFDELGSGEKRSIKISYRIKPGTAIGTSLALKNILTYQDQVGNSY